MYYLEEDPYFKYVYLDSSSYSLNEVQQAWLVEQLKTDKDVVVFIHHPILPVHTEMDNKYPLQGREKLEELLKQHQKKVYIFCGHYHTSDIKTVGNITQYVTPASSFQVVKQMGKVEFDAVTFGYRLIEITDAQIETEVVLLG